MSDEDRLTPGEMADAGLDRVTPAEMKGRNYAQPKSMTADDQALGLERGPITAPDSRFGLLTSGYPGGLPSRGEAVGPEQKRLDDAATMDLFKEFLGHVGKQSLGGLGGAAVGAGLGTPAVQLGGYRLLSTAGEGVSHGAPLGAIIGHSFGHNPLYSALIGALLKPTLMGAGRVAPQAMEAASVAAPSAGQALIGSMPSSGPGLLMGLPPSPALPDTEASRQFQARRKPPPSH